MSMNTLTALQFLKIASVYAFMTLLLPAILLHKKISGMVLAVRFMIYQAIGNFYMITLVLILQLLHICNWFTLVIFTAGSFFAAYAVFHVRNPRQDLQVFLYDIQKLLEGKYGLRLFLSRIFRRVCNAVKRFVITEWKHFCSNLLDVTLVAGVIAAVMVTYGANMFMQYGYCTSDIVVHNYWINRMGKGEMFAAGVYPFGFHCVIYYLHTVFFIETYVLLRLFWVVQTLVIHVMLLIFIQLCCKTKYTAYAGLGIYTLVELFHMNTYSRYISSLPQEFGMVFILPSAAFLFLFLEKKKEELAQEETDGKEKRHRRERKRYKENNKRTDKKNRAAKKQEESIRQLKLEEQKADRQEEERVYFLDDVLAESEEREAAAEKNHIPAKEALYSEEKESILLIEENPEDGSLYIKEVPLGYGGSESKTLASEKADYEGSDDRISVSGISDLGTADSETADDEISDPEILELKADAEGNLLQRTLKMRKLKKGSGAGSRFLHVLKREYETQSSWYLFFFMINFSLTFTVHFYNTMIAGILCMGIAVGYGFRLFRRRYFGRIMSAGVLAMIVAVLPLLTAYLAGVPLEGSLRWGMQVINGTVGQTGQKTETEKDAEEEKGKKKDDDLSDVQNYVILTDSVAVSAGKVISKNAVLEEGTVVSRGDVFVEGRLIEGGQMVEDAKLSENGKIIYEGMLVAVGYELSEEEDNHAAEPDSGLQKVINTVRRKAYRMGLGVYNTIDVFLYQEEISPVIIILTPCSVVLLFVLAVIYFVLRRTDYAARLMSVAVYMGLMTVMFSAVEFGLPEMMGRGGRTCVYYAYTIVAVWCLCADGIVQMVFGWMKKNWIPQFVSFLLIPLLAAAVLLTGSVKKTYYTDAMQPNDAIICLTNIIKDNKDMTWTIVSANDERRMAEDYGYHYEIDTFLRDMEHRGGGSTIVIPTKKVYFFIERRPIDYALPYKDSGQRVSRKGAARPLPSRGSVTMYWGENRWIEMSRMTFWIQMFKSMYPHEVEVYYETDDFICYCINQNEYSLFNFSINYLYNMMDYTAYTEEQTE